MISHLLQGYHYVLIYNDITPPGSSKDIIMYWYTMISHLLQGYQYVLIYNDITPPPRISLCIDIQWYHTFWLLQGYHYVLIYKDITPPPRISLCIDIKRLSHGWQLVRGLNLQKHHDCSHRSTSTNFGPGLDMTIIYQFLEGAKMGSRCGSHFGQIQDGRHPE